MEPFNPFAIKILLLFVATLLGSYLVGWLFYRSTNWVDNLACRLGFGYVGSLVMLAVAYSGIGTMAILLVPLFLFLAYQRFWPKTDGLQKEDQPIPLYEYLGLVLIAATFFLMDATRMDVRLSDGLLYIGNTDISYYGSVGRMMFEMREETLPTSIGVTNAKMVYHFGDMWISGIYSYFFDVLPYYAYGVLYRSTSATILFVLFFSFFRKSGGYVVAVFLSFLALTANHALLGYFPNIGIELFEPFTSSWPVYAESSYLILGIAALVFIKLIQSGRHTEGMSGLLLSAGLHSVFIVPSFIFAIGLGGFRLFFSKKYVTIGAPSRWLQVWVVVISGISVYAFVVLDSRSLSIPLAVSTNLLYLTVHTYIRSAFTIILLAPFVVGIAYLITQKKFRVTAVIVAGYCISGIVGFSLLYAIFQSDNTIKLLNGILSVLLFPLGIWGLAELFKDRKAWSKTLSVVCITMVILSTIIGFFQTSMFDLIYSWGNIPGHKEKWTLKAEDVITIRKALSKGVYAGYAVCNEELFEGDLIHYNSFVGINGLLDGGRIFRLNAVKNDTARTVEAKSWALKSAPVQYARQYKDYQIATNEYIHQLGIAYIIEDDSLTGLCTPEQLEIQTGERLNCGRYSLQAIEQR